jgi:hypothetical protein
MVSVIAWLGLPAMLCALAVGVGLLAERVARVKISNALLAPLGACVAVCLLVAVYRAGATSVLAAPLLCVLALAGFALARRELGRRLSLGPGVLAGAAAYALYLAPVVLSGHWTWLGYNFVNDTANNMVFASHLAAHGATNPEGPASTATAIVGSTLGSHYPLGAFALLATVRALLGIPMEAAYQPFIATLAALAAVSLSVLARRLGVRGVFAAAIGVLAAGSSLVYDYSLTGAIKEVALVFVLATAAAMTREALDTHWRAGGAALLGVVLAAGIGIFSAAAGGYVALTGVMVAAAYAIEPDRPRPRVALTAVVVGGIVAAVAVFPALIDALGFLNDTSQGFAGTGGAHGENSTQFFGFLARELPLYQALGVWPADDFRFPLIGTNWTLTIIAMVLAGALIAAAVVVELRRRRLGALLLLVPAVGTYLLATPRLSPYADAKLLVMISPAAVFSAGMGAWYLSRTRVPLRAAALAAAAIVAAGVVWSDAKAYHQAHVAPVSRLEALAEAADHAPAAGMLMLGEWEEFAKFFARDRQINVASEAFSPNPVVLRDPSVPIFAHSFDLDAMTLEYVEFFPSLLVRTGPDVSRPPLNFRLAYRNRYYELWVRGSAPAVREHLALQGQHDRGAVPRCAEVRTLARHARPGERLVAVPAPEPAQLDVAARPPIGWNENGIPDTVTPGNPGDAAANVRVAGGRYRVWVRGGSGRELKVKVDGRRVATVQGVDTPGQWLPGGTIRLSAGRHRLQLVRPGGGLGPGNGYAAEIGPVALSPVTAQRPVEITPADAASLCGKRWDWIERVRP